MELLISICMIHCNKRQYLYMTNATMHPITVIEITVDDNAIVTVLEVSEN